MNSPYVALWTILGLFGVAYLYWWRYRALRIDIFRQEIFELRDRLFDDAADGMLPFDHPAYLALRGIMNGYLRFAHWLNIWHIILMPRDSSDGQSFTSIWNRSTQNLPEKTVDRLNEYLNKMEWLLMKHLVLISLEALPLLVGIVGYLVVKILLRQRSRSQRQRRTWEQIQSWPYRRSNDAAFQYGQSKMIASH